MPRPRPLHTKLGIEPLEDRSLLAGNVVAVVTDGLLTILGDASANSVTISYDYATQTHYLAGKPLDGSPTLINGQDTASTGALPLTGVKSVQVRLAEGNDQLDFGNSQLTHAKIPQRLEIDMGAGDDTLTLGRAGNTAGGANPVLSRLLVNQGVYVNLGEGNDTLQMANLKVIHSLIVDAGAGNDDVSFANEFTPTGATTPTIFNVSVRGNLHVNLGTGDDSLTGAHVAVGQNLLVTDSEGTNTIDLTDLVIGNKFGINTGSGIDTVALDTIMAKSFDLKTNAGADDVEIKKCRFKRMNLNLGDDRDDLTIRTTRVTQYSYLDGGSGGSRYFQTGSALRGMLKRRMG